MYSTSSFKYKKKNMIGLKGYLPSREVIFSSERETIAIKNLLLFIYIF